MRTAIAALAALWISAAPVFAQEYAVSRRNYNFFGRSLTIEVLADGPGALQILRGERGRLEVAAHAREGLAAWAFGGDYRRDRLRLSALGALHADYAVIVPEHVHVNVSLPGERIARSVSRDAAELLRWGGDEPAAVEPAALAGPSEAGPFLVHSADASPDVVELPDAGNLRSIEVRLAGDRFLVSSSRPLAYSPGHGALVIRTGGDAMDLVITVPRETRNFRVIGPPGTLVQLDAGRLRTACRPSIQLGAPDRQTLTLSPAAGELHCR